MVNMKSYPKAPNRLISILVVLFFLSISPSVHGAQARSKLNNPCLSVKALNLERPPTTEALMAAGQLGGLLYPTRDWSVKAETPSEKTSKSKPLISESTIEADRKGKINLSFGEAIQAWNKHEYKKAVKLFKKHVEVYPDSPWVSEVVLHIGCDARYNGRYTEAEEKFRWIIEMNQGSDHIGKKMLLNKARQRLGVLKVLRNNFKEAAEHFRKLKAESPDWRHRTYASNWIQQLSRYKRHQLAMLNCGVLALAELLEGDGKTAEADQVRRMRPVSLKGHSIKDLASIAADYGYELSGRHLSINEVDEIPLPAVVQINGRNAADSGHYWILKKNEKGILTLLDPQSNRTFHQQLDEFGREWEGIVIVFSDNETLPGVKLADNELGNIYGGCCGAPLRTAGLGNPGSASFTPGSVSLSDPGEQACGSPTWNVNKINMNLFVTDTPLWYSPPIGPSVAITLSYNSQSAIVYNEPFGNKWQFNYGSYLMVDTGGSVIVVMPDGRRDMYMPDGMGSYVRPYQVFNTLTKIAENHFELRFPDDTVYVYDIPPGTSSLQPFLVEIRDAYGQSLTLGYDANVQLATITDATGKITTLSYNVDGLVTQVADPFGRFAAFEYDTNRNLIKITDMGGYWSAFSYDNDIYLTGMENSRSEWVFKIEPADGIPENSDIYPPPDDIMWESYRITITDPLGHEEEYFYYGGCDEFTCSGYTWHVSSRDYIPWQSPEINNFDSDAPRTRYFLSQPTSTQWGEISKILYPEGGHVEYGYDGVGNRTSITDSHGHTTQFTFNNMGRITSITDPKGNVINVVYAQNDVDPIRIQDGSGIITVTYNDFHDVTSIVDPIGNTTTFTYNGFGQRISETNALGVVTSYIYNPQNQLQQITKDGKTLEGFTFDALGRVKTHTDSSGLVLAYDYNDLDNITMVTYPDGKFESYTYSDCCPHLFRSATDRGGRTSFLRYDALRQLIQVINDEGGVTNYTYDKNANWTGFIDPNGNHTSYAYDLDNRLVEETYDDGKHVSFVYDAAGFLTNRTNARGITTAYTYDENGNTLTVTYSDGTPSVSNTYDAYNRRIQRHDSTGTYQYTYDANSQLLTVDGPWDADTLTYNYDMLGRRTSLFAQGGQNIAWVYDSLGRLANVQAGASSYTYGYEVSANPLLQSITRPNGSRTIFQRDNVNSVTEVSNRNSSDEIINRYVYTYNQEDNRSSETITNGIPMVPPQRELTTYDYNKLNQLLSSSNPSKTFVYDYDGNMTQGYTPEGYVFTGTYDAENRLSSIAFTDGSGISHRTEFVYRGDSFLGKKIEYENGNVVGNTRLVRDGFLPLQERDGSNNVRREYLWGLDMGGGIGGLLHLRQEGQGFSYLYDGKGNVTTLLDTTQSIVASYRYDAFGRLMSSTGSLEQPFKFSTRRYDEQTGLSYYGYRYYSSALGRWMTRDPLGEAGGINLYGFVGNNPVSFWDPLGTTCKGGEPVKKGIATGIAYALSALMKQKGYAANMMDYGGSTKREGEVIISTPPIRFDLMALFE